MRATAISLGETLYLEGKFSNEGDDHLKTKNNNLMNVPRYVSWSAAILAICAIISVLCRTPHHRQIISIEADHVASHIKVEIGGGK